MKRNVYIGVVSLFVLFFLIWNNQVYAATPTTAPTSKEKTTLSTSTAPMVTEAPPMKKEEYILPYPGILPDNPLYIFKTLRDKVLESLIVDPARKAEFYLLMADKHLSMSMTIQDQAKSQVAVKVISGDIMYMSKAVASLQMVKQSGKAVSASAIDKIGRSLDKHIEVLSDIATKTTDTAEKSAIATALDAIKKLQQDVASLK